MRKLKINSENGYLNMEDLPHNCIFNKVVTGCGGTTIALRNKEDYVITVPTTELIVNKTGKVDADESEIEGNLVFGLFGEFNDSVKSRFRKYLAKSGTKKIICTYDKLPKLVDFIKTENYRLLVDEYHCLLKAYSYRSKAIDGVLNNFRKYKSFCFMSATPILPDFKPDTLSDVEEIEAVWENVDTMYISLQQTNKPFVKVANIIASYQKDGFIEIGDNKSYEAFFFINSVTDIAAILQYCNLKKDEVKIVCADNERNRNLVAPYEISNSRSANKKFTFITSKSFEGADYYSDSAMCFVVSSGSKQYTLAGIDTDIPQIAGRIRTRSNPFRNTIIHIYSTTKLNLDVTYEEMKERTEKALNKARKTADYFNNADDDIKEHLLVSLQKSLNDLYATIVDDEFVVNDLLPKLELYNYKLNQVIYKDGISLIKNYQSQGILTSSPEYEGLEDSIDKAGKKLSFKDAFIKYADYMSRRTFTFKIEELVRQQPLIAGAYHKLGVEKVRSLNYVKYKVKEAMKDIERESSTSNKIVRRLNEVLPVGFNSSAYIKAKLVELYKDYNLTGTPKATDIKKWYECEEISKRVDGKVTKGFNIIRPKIIFK